MSGLCLVRGEPIPVLDLRHLLGSTSAPESARRMVILRLEARRAGLLVDGVQGVRGEASKEIELSTKQQASAVEQVNIAVTNVAQASKETELSTGQTLRTASELSALSRDLLKLIQPDLSAAARPNS